jgi:threonylcarbamoyladenosine tRNA methylthiotransferase MtaB
MKKVAFYTLGCKLNFSETSTIKRSFADRDFEITRFDEKADVYVINTCSVTQDANRDCRKIVRRARRKNKNAFIAVTGCYAQLEPEEIAQIDGVDLVMGARDKFKIHNLIPGFHKQDETVIHHSDVNEAVDFHNAFSSNDRTRAFLKIQDGCDYKCSFCTIPLARGKSRSPETKEILRNAREVISQGYKEIVVTGVNAGDFGKNNGENFLDLLQHLDQLKGMERIRISSIEPNLLSDEIILFAGSSKTIQPHFHIPLQSGSDAMLKTMRRRYKSDLYEHKVQLIKEVMPHACIGVDVITGHPGETDELFQESYDFISSLPVSYLHVFTYSERPNTHALSIEPVVDKQIRKKRTHRLRRLSKKKKFNFDTQYVNSIRSVLFEDSERGGLMYGYTDNYIRVIHPYIESLTGRPVDVKILSVNNKAEADVVILEKDFIPQRSHQQINTVAYA